MILQAMLQRLFASLMRGPGLSARPHNSRQRIDAMDLRHFGGASPERLLAELLEKGSVDFPATVPAFKKPEYPESEWSDEQKSSKQAADRQGRLLGKLRDIAQDAIDYYNDHGEQALFIGFPLLSLPAAGDRFAGKSNRILAPILLAPVNLRVRRTTKPGVSIELAAEGADRVMANPALLAWIEQQTGSSSEELFTDEGGEETWKEIAEVIAHVAKAAGTELLEMGPETVIAAVPKTDELPAGPAMLPAAVLGLLPLANPGLLRDTRWMAENEPALGLPVSAFLKPAALMPPQDHALPEEEEHDPASVAQAGPDYAAEWLVTQADPCQAGAVAHARKGGALVIHGPPGTGKSQTIANIIGDHLARGEKVLFVCDKRTALDVVKYRLDGMGLGALCGVIHDPQRDRRDLYLGLRDRLQELPQSAPVADPKRELEAANQRLGDLHGELRNSYAQLHAPDADGGRSFHELAGEWFEASAAATSASNSGAAEGLTLEMIAKHRTDADEVLRRSLAAGWKDNPFRGTIGIPLGDFLTKSRQEHLATLEKLWAAAKEADANGTPALDPGIPPEAQAAALLALAEAMDDFATGAIPAWTSAAAKSAVSVDGLADHAAALDTALERELVLQTKGTPLAMGVLGSHLLALAIWQEKAKSWTKLFAFGPKKAAVAALLPLGLPLSDEAVARAVSFYSGLRSRWMWTDLLDRLQGSSSNEPAADAALQELRDRLPKLRALLEAAKVTAAVAQGPRVLEWLAGAEGDGKEIAGRAREAAQRAKQLAAMEAATRNAALFNQASCESWFAAWRGGEAVAPRFEAMCSAAATLEEVVRREDRMGTIAGPLRAVLEEAALAGQDWAKAEPGIRAAALALEIRERLRRSPELARLDTKRIEAAFAELLERSYEKQAAVRAHILHLWQQKWQRRLLATTGSRLNSDGAALRQRLFVRGQKAMKLRQMIAAGAASEGGDPLFELCPVWMASPATVAQIFPREALFDVIVFDEASQCRLEEALPVLLRGKRTVIAGDPKQLPPTRFFEQALAESDDTSAETADEVFEQQQAEAEDLLTAALNLDVQEAFLDVHYRSRNEALIGFSNDSFYGSRLQPIPGHPRNKALATPIRLIRVDGVYQERANVAEAKRAAELVAELLEEASPPSIGIACFNITQRDAILDALEERAAADATFAERLEVAKQRRGRDSFEGLFVKNLENVQGDERDHLIICTTFGPDAEGKFRRNFGALSRSGGERRLNVLVTRARDAIHVLSSIPRAEYLVAEVLPEGQKPNGRHYLYDYLRYAERLAGIFERWQDEIEHARRDAEPALVSGPTENPSRMVEALGKSLFEENRIGSTVYWGNDGFRVDIALTHPALPEDVTIGVLADFTRYRKSSDPVIWEQFRSQVLRANGWELHRVWTPAIFRDAQGSVEDILEAHARMSKVPVEERERRRMS